MYKFSLKFLLFKIIFASLNTNLVNCDVHEVVKSEIKLDDTNIQFIKIESNGNLNLTEFSRLENNCGGNFRDDKILIQSPNYPLNYESNLVCEYFIKSPFVCRTDYYFEFLEFSLESSDNCEKDKLKVGDKEVLCGKIIGGKKYTSNNGILKLKFITDSEIQSKGFKILVTRLPCISNEGRTIEPIYFRTTEPTTVFESTTSEYEVEGASETNVEVTTEIGFELTNRIPDISEPMSNLLPPKIAANNGYLPPSRQYLPSYPGVTQYPDCNHIPQQPYYPQQPIYPQVYPQQPYPQQPNYPQQPTYPQEPYYPQQPNYPQQPYYPQQPNYPHQPTYPQQPNYYPQIYPGYPNFQPQETPTVYPQCCSTEFNQDRFYLSNPGFPSNSVATNDCHFTINRISKNSCRLKIEFKFFFVGIQDTTAACQNDYLEVDGQRLCGCRSGLIYSSQWGESSKVIRFKSSGIFSNAIRGFLLDVTQEDCPLRHSGLIRNKRTFLSNFKYNYAIRPYHDTSYKIQTPQRYITPRNSTALIANYYLFEETPNGVPNDFEIETRAETPISNFSYSKIFGSNQCQFGYFEWVRLSVDSLWTNRQVCRSLTPY